MQILVSSAYHQGLGKNVIFFKIRSERSGNFIELRRKSNFWRWCHVLVKTYSPNSRNSGYQIPPSCSQAVRLWPRTGVFLSYWAVTTGLWCEMRSYRPQNIICKIKAASPLVFMFLCGSTELGLSGSLFWECPRLTWSVMEMGMRDSQSALDADTAGVPTAHARSFWKWGLCPGRGCHTSTGSSVRMGNSSLWWALLPVFWGFSCWHVSLSHRGAFCVTPVAAVMLLRGRRDFYSMFSCWKLESACGLSEGWLWSPRVDTGQQEMPFLWWRRSFLTCLMVLA